MKNLTSLNDLFVHELRDLYSAEQQLVQALPKMANAASSSELRMAFNEHLEQTQNHVRRLDKIFSSLGMNKDGEMCKGMQGLIREGEDIINATGSSIVKDAALIGAAQRVEHYEIAGYGTARTYAEELGFSEAAKMLQDTLDEEGMTNKKLTKLATGGFLSKGINEKAEMK